ncbi:MAG: NAD-dependent epimerase/dehydratase family protein, partial [Actinobacteria bacterium]|nr:NAD-dependent epimerase/dehydratase family protein [Actinomycetota bacterium]
MRVLVTGGAGFIGSHLVDALLARGDEVAVVDDMSTGRPGRVAAGAAVHKLSVADAAAVAAATEEFGPQLICHLAAQVDVRASVSNPADDALVNVVGTVNVLEAARAVGAQVILGSTGALIYGRDAPIPSMEDVLPLPESPYGVAKHSAEQYIELYNRLHGTSHVVLRFANVYGPRQDPAGQVGVVSIFCAQALAGQPSVIYGDGTQTRDFVYVSDAVNAYLAASDRGRPGTWNIGSGVEVRILELARVVGEVVGRQVEP